MAELCARCGGSFASPSELMTHVRKAHPERNPAETLAMNPASRTPGFVCSFCGRTFASPEELARHDLKPHRLTRRFGRVSPT
ncbi:MAG: C2H2-type zinc finger protein [Thermoplasmata archaeon]